MSRAGIVDAQPAQLLDERIVVSAIGIRHAVYGIAGQLFNRTPILHDFINHEIRRHAIQKRMRIAVNRQFKALVSAILFGTKPVRRTLSVHAAGVHIERALDAMSAHDLHHANVGAHAVVVAQCQRLVSSAGEQAVAFHFDFRLLSNRQMRFHCTSPLVYLQAHLEICSKERGRRERLPLFPIDFVRPSFRALP